MRDRPLLVVVSLLVVLLGAPPPAAAQPSLQLQSGDRICLLGSAQIERMQHHGWLETRLQLRGPGVLSFRNLGFSADTLTVQQRTAGFGSWDDYLTRCEADVIIACFGYVESFDGPAGLAGFREELDAFIGHVREQRYNGRTPPRLAFLTPVPCEDLGDPLLPDPAAENARMAPYLAALREVAGARGVPVLDIVDGMAERYVAEGPLTHDGIHLTERGNRALAELVEAELFPGELPDHPAARLDSVRQAVLYRNRMWFNRYRATDGYNVYGGRSSLAYVDGQTNYEVLQREMEWLDAECANADLVIQAAAATRPVDIVLSPNPPLIDVPTNRPGPGPDGAHLFLDGERAIEEMTPAPGLAVSLVADEAAFPELANPVQMAFDTQGRLWVACWPTYPHWTPGQPMNDKLVIVHDDDGDGRADRTTLFADDLHNPTGFEFWNGGVLVAAQPDILFLKDTDGDDRYDTSERILHGLSSADTHHAANSFVFGPDGALYFQEGTFHMSQVESVYGPVRSVNACSWRYEPRTRRVERYTAYNFANPHGHVFDRWGQDFLTDGTGNVNYYALPFSGRLPEPLKHGGYFPFFQQRSRPAAATELLASSHFPERYRDSYLIANVIGFQGIFQYRVEDDGSGFAATEIDPLVQSADPNFRPVDLEVGPDGALYFIDWHNPLIGHMQHHLRDPSRDTSHGRVYRVTAEGRELLSPPSVADQPVDALVRLLDGGEDRLRYRVGLELSGRDSAEVVAAARRWLDELRSQDRDSEPQQLEVLWLQQQHGVLDDRLLRDLLTARDPRVRAAAVRVARQMRHDLSPAEAHALLGAAVEDDHPRVRLEGVVGLSFLDTAHAAELALRQLDHPGDRFLDYALEETLRGLRHRWEAALVAGQALCAERPAGLARLLAELSTEQLADVRPGPARDAELLRRHGLSATEYLGAARSLAGRDGRTVLAVLLDAVDAADARSGGHVDHLLSGLFSALHAARHEAGSEALPVALAQRARSGRRRATRRLATAARILAEGSLERSWAEAGASVGGLVELLEAAPLLDDAPLREQLFDRVAGLLDELPPALAARLDEGARPVGRFVRVELPGRARTLTLAEVQVFSDGVNVARGGEASQSSTNWGGVPERGVDGITSSTWSAGGQTHTQEDQPDPWWEVDLGAEHALDAIAVWNRNDSNFARRLDDYVLTVLDGERRTVWTHREPVAADISRTHQLGSDADTLRRAALTCLAALGVRRDEAADLLLASAERRPLRVDALRALGSLPVEELPAATRGDAVARLTLLLRGADDAFADTDAGQDLLALADQLAAATPGPAARELLDVRRRLGPQIVVLRPVRDSLLFDRTEVSVVAGRPVELVFENVDIMPHNLVLASPGALATVGLAAEAMARDPDAWAAAFVPDLPQVLQHTGLLQPGQRQTLRFDAPAEPGDYPYVCTFPGHWIRMNGTLHVVASYDELDAPGQPAVAEAPVAATRRFVAAWTLGELLPDLADLLAHADATRGRAVLEEASCTRCHQVGGEGGLTGPPLEEALTRHATPADVLGQILDPSAIIAEGYLAELFVSADGSALSGRVLAEDETTVHVQDDPYSEGTTALDKATLQLRRPSAVSAMPEGLLWTYEAGEIADLLAYLETLRGDG